MLPDILKSLWETVDEKRFTGAQFYAEQERLLNGYRRTWKQALVLDGHKNMKASLLSELGSYVECKDLTELERRGQNAMTAAKREWQGRVHPSDRQAVEQYYEESTASIYELLYWHTLEWDTSPLAYVMALHFARWRRCRNCLDFGAGVGSGGILFARHDLNVTLADISSPMLRFSKRRFRVRELPARFIDLKRQRLPNGAFDIIAAMDVFEHLFDPVRTAEELWKALKPRGFLFARFGIEPDEEQPQHIVRDFGPTFKRMRKLGFAQVWQDEWLWGHQVFQKRLSH